ncbi:MAG: adenosine kinase [Acidimicrobiaceae bacterium]|nr:adenosine kinase [Acidimicrobiaceae bacterium]
MQPALDVVGVGNAIVDVIATVDDSFIGDRGLVKGAMTLVNAGRSAELYEAMPPGVAASGGSAANTMAGVASFGGRAAFIGKVRDDQLGEVFIHDIRATGVAFEVPPAPEGPSTARCLVQVTPDAERTMNTYLGISALLGPPDVDADVVASAGITYCEGYLWDVPVAKEAIRVAMAAAASADRTVALALCDSYCVDRHRDEWLDLIEDRVDVVFANEAEVCALHSTDDLGEARDRTAEMARTVVITRGARGSVAVQGSELAMVPAAEIPDVVDATGAGDLYAAGFLWGLCRGVPLARCAELGSLAAAEVISHVGARPRMALSRLAATSGLA